MTTSAIEGIMFLHATPICGCHCCSTPSVDQRCSTCLITAPTRALYHTGWKPATHHVPCRRCSRGTTVSVKNLLVGFAANGLSFAAASTTCQAILCALYLRSKTLLAASKSTLVEHLRLTRSTSANGHQCTPGACALLKCSGHCCNVGLKKALYSKTPFCMYISTSK